MQRITRAGLKICPLETQLAEAFKGSILKLWACTRRSGGAKASQFVNQLHKNRAHVVGKRIKKFDCARLTSVFASETCGCREAAFHRHGHQNQAYQALEGHHHAVTGKALDALRQHQNHGANHHRDVQRGNPLKPALGCLRHQQNHGYQCRRPSQRWKRRRPHGAQQLNGRQKCLGKVKKALCDTGLSVRINLFFTTKFIAEKDRRTGAKGQFDCFFRNIGSLQGFNLSKCGGNRHAGIARSVQQQRTRPINRLTRARCAAQSSCVKRRRSVVLACAPFRNSCFSQKN